MPFERVQIDLMDLRSDPSDPNKWILHIKDHFTKLSLFYILEDKTSRGVAKKLNTFMTYLGTPYMSQADKRKEFKGFVTTLLMKRGADIINGRPRAPQAQGLVEKGNGTAKDRLAIWKKGPHVKTAIAQWNLSKEL